MTAPSDETRRPGDTRARRLYPARAGEAEDECRLRVQPFSSPCRAPWTAVQDAVGWGAPDAVNRRRAHVRMVCSSNRRTSFSTDVPPLKRARFSGNGLNLFHFSALWEFLLGGYSGRGQRQRGRDGDAGGVEQSADVVARRRNLMIGRSSADADFGDAQAGEAVESFLDRQVAVAPAPPELLRHQIGQHDDDGMAARAILGAQIDRPPRCADLLSRNAHSTWARSL